MVACVGHEENNLNSETVSNISGTEDEDTEDSTGVFSEDTTEDTEENISEGTTEGTTEETTGDASEDASGDVSEGEDMEKDYAADTPAANITTGDVHIVVKKSERVLELWQGETLMDTFPIGLGFTPEGHKQVEGDGKTPEGEYYVCVKNSNSSFYLSLGVSYPNKEDAAAALADGRIDSATYDSIAYAIDHGQRPDWNTPLGGAIMIHGCGSDSDWTRGCIAVDNEVMDVLFDYCSVGTRITILP